MRKALGWAVLIVTAGSILAACGGDGDEGRPGTAGTVTGDPGIKVAEVVARTDAAHQPVDAAPSPDGGVIYFAATGDAGSAVFSVPAGGGAVAKIIEGAPLARPSGVAVATDGNRLFVADRLARQAGGTVVGGAILTVPTTGTSRAATLLAGTGGRAPRGLDVVRQGGTDVIYLTGTDPANGAPGLFQVPAAGGTVVTVAQGEPFISPDSVVVGAGGVAYVSDQGSGPGQGQVFRVSGGSVTPLLTRLHLGAPGGVTLIRGDTTLLVSSIDPATRSDQLLLLDLATGRTSATTEVIGTNKDSSGGLHRALNAPVLAWCDVSRGGAVYRIEP